MFVAIHPKIDVNRLHNNDLLYNIEQRRLNIDLKKLIKRYHFFRNVEDKKVVLEQTRDEINALYKELSEQSEQNLHKINQLKLHKYIVMEELKSLKEFFSDLEENVMISLLNLPNDLHEHTPEYDQIYYEYLEKPKHQSKNHMDTAIELGLLKIVGKWGYYLKSDASLFELSISNYFMEKLVELGYIPFQNADFTRSVVIEGCGTKIVGNQDVLTIYEPNVKNHVLEELSRLHLTGSASTYAFMAYFSKNLVPYAQFPLKYFCYGRSYNGVIRSTNNLFNLNQESVLNVFIAMLDTDVWHTFQTLVKQIIEIYDKLGWHYRLVYLQPNKLHKSESLKLSIQMYSTFNQEYVEVGYVSYFGSYISERLLFCSLDKEKEQIYPNIISGNILNVHQILGCVIENQVGGEKLLSGLLSKYVP